MAYIFIYQFRILFTERIIYSYSVLSGNWSPIGILWWRGITWWCIIWWGITWWCIIWWCSIRLKLLLRLILSWSWLKTGIVNNHICLWLHDWLNWCWSCDNCCLRMFFFIFVSSAMIIPTALYNDA